MNPTTILDITREALLLVLMLSLPVALVSTLTALVVAIIQAVTQVQDSSIAMSMRTITVMITLLVLSGWFGSQLLRFAQQALDRGFQITAGSF